MLPVQRIADDITAALREGNRLVLSAPTGSGKSTQVPRIAHEAGLGNGRVICLQPRRLAARLVARRVAEEMGEPLGNTVGFVTRHERQISDDSRIVFMTEGLLLRHLQRDPKLSGVDAVILDEFHERNLPADMALGLLRNLDLRVVVMSATLDVERIAEALGAPVLETQSRAFDVDVSYLPSPTQAPCWDLAAAALRNIDDDGDVLIFMPGVYEIGRTLRALPRGVFALPLHGSLSPAEQDKAVAPADRRKVIVATNVAETSITIEGVRHVIDSGLARIHRYDAARDINVLKVEPISRASADQRAGRAGRTAPGSCQRLWTQRDHARREAHTAPEVQRVELSAALLQLADIGVASFQWLDPPPEEAVNRATQLLQTLGAIEANQLTPRGRQMATFGEHPRLARMLLEAAERGCLKRAIHWAAILSERDNRKALPNSESAQSDLEVIERGEKPSREVASAMRIHRDACRRAKLSFDGPGRTDDLIKCVLAAMPDHVAVLRDAKERYCLMQGRKRVMLDGNSRVQTEGPIVAMQVSEIGRGDSSQTMLSLVSAVDPAWLEPLIEKQTLEWNGELGLVEEVTQRCYGELPVTRAARHVDDPIKTAPVLVEQIMQGAIELTNWNAAVEQWIERVRCVHEWFPDRDLIDYDEDDRRVILLEIIDGATKATHVRDRDCMTYVRHALSWDDQQFVEKMTPTQIALPNGWKMKVDYETGSPPRGRAKIQDLYDVNDTPRVGGGRVKVLLEILGPNFRPVQVTDDLAGFWARLYPEVRKELKRRYPKHEWR